MNVFLIDGHPSLTRVDAADWAAAEAMLDGKGQVIGQLVAEAETKAAAAFGELKFAQDDGTMRFSGYGAVFNNVDLGGDKILPGAFAETLAQHKANGSMPQMLLEHGAKAGGPVMPVGIWTMMQEDAHGLRVEGQLADTSLGRDAYALMKMGALKGLSIGYRPTELARPGMHEAARRVIKSAMLGEVSIVGSPMNTAAKVTAIKSADEIKTIRDLESALRDAGYSKADALRICAGFEAKSDRRDAEAEEARKAALAADRLIAMLKGNPNG